VISKELIKLEIDRVSEERLEELYSVIKTYSARSAQNGGPSFMSKYLTGESIKD
jgi:hypothetical protein